MRIKSLFYKKIFCLHCKSGCKKKTERGVVKYICSNYDNYGNCQRNIIREDKLVKAINRRFKKELSNEEIRELVLEVIVESENLFDVVLTEGKTISYHNRGIVF